MTIPINNKDYDVPGLDTISWKDGVYSWVKHITDKSPRNRAIKNIIAHTNEGLNSVLEQGFGPSTTIAENLVRYQVNTERQVSWDYTIDRNGTVYVQNDPVINYSWQAGFVNPSSVGFELVQVKREDGKRVLWSGQIDKTVLLIDFLTATLGIQRQIAWDKSNNKPCLTQIQRVIDSNNFYGILGHVNLTKDRGRGDPGEHIFNALRDAGYELFDVSLKEDLEVWKERQRSLGLSNADGIPGKQTVELIKSSGRSKFGLWVSRPIDQYIDL